jgi:hypothetical protein
MASKAFDWLYTTTSSQRDSTKRRGMKPVRNQHAIAVPLGISGVGTYMSPCRIPQFSDPASHEAGAVRRGASPRSPERNRVIIVFA